MIIAVKFELLEIFPQENKDDFRIVFSYEKQKLEEQVAIVNSTESSPLQIQLNKDRKDLKIQVQLFKKSENLGTADLTIPYTLLLKREEAFKKWLNINEVKKPKDHRDKLNFTMNLINSIRLNLKANFQYLDNSQENSKLSDKDLSKNSVRHFRKGSYDERESIDSKFTKYLDKLKNSLITETTPRNNLNRSQLLSQNNNESIKNINFNPKKINTRFKNMSCGDINTSNFMNANSNVNLSSSKILQTYQPNQSLKINNNKTKIASKISSPSTSKISLISNHFKNSVSKLNKGPECSSSRNFTPLKQCLNSSLKKNMSNSKMKLEESTPRKIKSEISINLDKVHLEKLNANEEDNLKNEKIILNTERNFSHLNLLSKEKSVENLMSLSNLEHKASTNYKNDKITKLADHSVNNDINAFSDTSTSQSSIDPLFNWENDATIDDLHEKLNSCLKEYEVYYNTGFFEFLPDDQFYLQFEIKMMFDKFLEIREFFLNIYSPVTQITNEMKQFLISYNDKYRLILKKLNKLKEQSESTNIKHNITSGVEKHEINNQKEESHIIMKEINMLKFILNLKQEKTEIQQNLEKIKIAKENYLNDRKCLFDLAHKIFGEINSQESSQENKIVIDKLSDGQKLILTRILNKNKKLNLDNFNTFKEDKNKIDLTNLNTSKISNNNSKNVSPYSAKETSSNKVSPNRMDQPCSFGEDPENIPPNKSNDLSKSILSYTPNNISITDIDINKHSPLNSFYIEHDKSLHNLSPNYNDEHGIESNSLNNQQAFMDESVIKQSEISFVKTELTDASVKNCNLKKANEGTSNKGSKNVKFDESVKNKIIESPIKKRGKTIQAKNNLSPISTVKNKK